MVKRGASINEVDKSRDQFTPLHCAAYYGSLEVIYFYIVKFFGFFSFFSLFAYTSVFIGYYGRAQIQQWQLQKDGPQHILQQFVDNMLVYK